MGESKKTIKRLILEQIEMNSHVTVNQIAEAISKSRSTALREIARLKENGTIARIGSPYSGCWQILKGENKNSE
ncbi:MAG: winged helix-turn-helix domain-containing protein [Synergistaceae bacterium]|jgi:DNA-binding Lrp family transcriptional regulator|nr:winged helix-turn-helix domain-containing protein [Synergistaceae bacterium]